MSQVPIVGEFKCGVGEQKAQGHPSHFQAQKQLQAGRDTTTRYGGIKVRWKKIQHKIGHFLVLVEYISIALSYKRKKFTVQFFNNQTLKCLNVNGS